MNCWFQTILEHNLEMFDQSDDCLQAADDQQHQTLREGAMWGPYLFLQR
jgi:hypothetical protein